MLDGRSPLDMAMTGLGARQVEALLWDSAALKGAKMEFPAEVGEWVSHPPDNAVVSSPCANALRIQSRRGRDCM
ncbi:MAG: MbcA/ParS/Xre antitoxin family protein [Pseudomonadota bacterium]|nr:MbcA/ParS/Xre antitoxin family protein [Pseudomonadota bacterium]